MSLLCGSFGALLLSPDSLTVGASGAVFGLMGAAAVVARNRGLNLMESGLGLWIGLNLLITFTIPNISIGGHIGGLVGGTVAALLLLELPERMRLPDFVPELVCRGDRRRGRGRLDRDLGLAATRSSSIERRVGGAGTSSGWSRWPSSSTPSTRRGPGREKYAAASTANHARAERGEPLALLHRLRGGLLGVVAARHRDDHLGRHRLELGPLGRARLLAGRARARRSPPASSIICGTQWPPMKIGSSHSSAATRGRGAPSTARSTASIRAAASSASRSPASSAPAACGEARHVGQHLAEGRRVERDHLRLRRQPLGHRAHVVERDGAHLAHGLGHDQVHVELLERRLVELVERLAAAGALAHRGVDLGRGQPLGDHAAREVGELFRAGRVVTLMCDRGDAVAEAEGEQHLGGGRNE